MTVTELIHYLQGLVHANPTIEDYQVFLCNPDLKMQAGSALDYVEHDENSEALILTPCSINEMLPPINKSMK